MLNKMNNEALKYFFIFLLNVYEINSYLKSGSITITSGRSISHSSVSSPGHHIISRSSDGLTPHRSSVFTGHTGFGLSVPSFGHQSYGHSISGFGAQTYGHPSVGRINTHHSISSAGSPAVSHSSSSSGVRESSVTSIHPVRSYNTPYYGGYGLMRPGYSMYGLNRFMFGPRLGYGFGYGLYGSRFPYGGFGYGTGSVVPSYNPLYSPAYSPSYNPLYNPSYNPAYNPSYNPSYNPRLQSGYYNTWPQRRWPLRRRNYCRWCTGADGRRAFRCDCFRNTVSNTI